MHSIQFALFLLYISFSFEYHETPAQQYSCTVGSVYCQVQAYPKDPQIVP